MTAQPAFTAAREKPETSGRIPVRNLWLLLLYASNLARFGGRFDAAVEESPELPRQLLRQGKVACRFEEHTIDTPRNRLVRSALDALASRVTEADLAHRCRVLAGDLGRLGVSGIRPSRAELVSDQIGRHDADDLLMVELARLVFDLVLPTENEGAYALTRAERDDIMVRKLFEKAIGNFYAIELKPQDGWRVSQGQRFDWPVQEATPGVAAILPGMKTDIILENLRLKRRIVIDTKFTDILTRTAYRESVLKSGYLYQMYAYLRSQEDKDELASNAEGWLLHPATSASMKPSACRGTTYGS